MTTYQTLTSFEKTTFMDSFEMDKAQKLLTLQDQMNGIPMLNLSYAIGVKLSTLEQITCSTDCWNIFYKTWDMNNIGFMEEFKVMFLNRANKVIGIHSLSKGGVSGTVVDPKLVFSTALLACASSIILGHNHPSGNINPSQADKTLTKKMKEAGKLLDISVLDHIILTTENYYSFADDGEL